MLWTLTGSSSTVFCAVMTFNNMLLQLLLFSLLSVDANEITFNHLKPLTSSEVQENAAVGIIERLLPEHINSFKISVDPLIGPNDRDTFQVTKLITGDAVSIVGTSGVAVAWGFHYYLKYYCNCHISWDSDQLDLPDNLPLVNVSITSPDRFRYYQNVCTTSYSFVWWDWQRWQREIDWMALNGFNLVLAFTGQEAIWQRVYRQLNLTDTDINEHFSGPAFFSWNRMGNMRGWGGPLSDAWHKSSINLQHSILDRMRALGIVPVLPAFAGHVPRAFKSLFPNAEMTMMGTWNSFQDAYCCPYLLEPTDPLFRTVGNLFTKELIAEFGTDHAYNGDTFNEMLPRTNNITYLALVGKAVFRAMTDVDPKAIWMLQGWLFINAPSFWEDDQTRAFLESVPKGRMIVLDLQSELLPQYERLHSYFGQPFIWCMLHNFGGTLGLYGSVDNVNKGVFEGRSMINSTMIGTGLTPEGINQNYVVYDLMNDLAYRTKPVNLTVWFTNYARKRYGKDDAHANQAWQLLKLWYNPLDVAASWDELILASPALHRFPNYQHDIVDVTRQALQLIAAGYYTIFVNAFKKQDNNKFQKHASLFLNVFDDLDILLASNKDFLLGSWLNAAKDRASSPLESRAFEFNARNQITLWGPRGEIKDYANKQWAGVVSHYFRPRWQLFVNALNTSLLNKTAFDETATGKRIFLEVEKPFTLDTSTFSDHPQGNSSEISIAIHQRWRNQTRIWNTLRRFQLPPLVTKSAEYQKRSTTPGSESDEGYELNEINDDGEIDDFTDIDNTYHTYDYDQANPPMVIVA